MNTADRSTAVKSRWGTRAAGVALAVMLETSIVAAAPPTQSMGTGGRPVTAAVTTPAAGPRVEITKHAFSLPTVTVPAGTTVTWVNHDDDAHTVVSTTALFRSPGLDTDDSFSYRFTKPGTYQYFCTLHPLMVGTVVVR